MAAYTHARLIGSAVLQLSMDVGGARCNGEQVYWLEHNRRVQAVEHQLTEGAP
jgi:hypothetical protein